MAEVNKDNSNIEHYYRTVVSYSTNMDGVAITPQNIPLHRLSNMSCTTNMDGVTITPHNSVPEYPTSY